MATAKIILRKNKIMQDGTNPIILQVIHNRKVMKITLGEKYRCFPNQWNEQAGRFTNKFEDHKEKNAVLKKIENGADDIIDDCLKTGKPFTLLSFEELFRNENNQSPTVFAFFEERIGEMKAKNQLSNSEIYDSVRRVLKQFEPKGNLMFADVNYKFLTRFEVFLHERGNNGGGIINYMKTFRALINEAMRRGYLSKELYPFKNLYNHDGYSFAHVKSDARPRALSQIDIDKFKNF